MSAENEKGARILSFKRPAKRGAPAAPAATATSAALELKTMLGVYERLIELLRETYDEGLDILTDSLVLSTVHCREALKNGIDEQTGQQMVKKMREELRQIPQTLRALLPGIGPRLGESIQCKLGIQFAKF
jgi:hypothetical protein